jgi:hypothetical protein
MDDSVLQRETRRLELARRLLSHGVRTRIIGQLTGLTRNRLATLRRRLGVPDRTRRRGPTPSSLDRFLREPLARSEAAAVTALCTAFDLPALERERSLMPAAFISLNYGERLCESYEAYRACYPRTKVELEELIMLRSRLAKGGRIELGKCRTCRCLVLIDRFNGQRNCWHCDTAGNRDKTRTKTS